MVTLVVLAIAFAIALYAGRLRSRPEYEEELVKVRLAAKPIGDEFVKLVAPILEWLAKRLK